MSIFRLNRVHWPAVKLAETLSFRAKLLLAMMLVVLAVLVATLYLAERNLRANQEKVLEIQYQNQVRSFLAGQEVQSRAIEQRCSALARSVRLRAALEERDEDDLYRNALTELQGIFGRPDSTDAPDQPLVRASFFRFIDQNGAVLDPGAHHAGEIDQVALEKALLDAGRRSLRGLNEQSIGFIAISRDDHTAALRQIVLTKIPDWSGHDLGALVVGFPVKQMRPANAEESGGIKSGIWLGNRLFI